MTTANDMVLTSVPKITAVNIVGLNNLILPFVPHVLGDNPLLDDSPGLENARVNPKQKYFIKTMTGLEPPPRNVAIAATAGGGRFQGITSEEREIVALIGMNPDFEAGESYALLRQNLETLLYPGYDPRVDIQAYAAIFPVFHEYGYVSNFDAAIFDANPVVQITFTMLNHNFRAFTTTSYAPTELSEKTPDVYNYGTAETGFQFGVKFDNYMTEWSIKQTENQGIGMTFKKPSGNFDAGDKLFVSTVPGQKFVHFQHGKGKVKNALGMLTGDSEWIQLHPGHNHFTTPAKVGRWEWQGPLSFTTRYSGV